MVEAIGLATSRKFISGSSLFTSFASVIIFQFSRLADVPKMAAP
jgi:hypothetical protein